MVVSAKADKRIRRTAMVGAATAAYFLLTADYGPNDHVLLPVQRAIRSLEASLKSHALGSAEDGNPEQKREQEFGSEKEKE